MRLLNATTLRLETFYEEATPSYAILSHTWGSDEVTFGELESLPTLSKSSQTRTRILQSKGYYKIKKCCAQAVEDGLQYSWVDTCCINKRSSAELSEAINSMFKWYKQAHICYAYLSDVNVKDAEFASFDRSYLEGARWFTRGWCLQELIAPKEIVFFARSWKRLGKKSEISSVLTDITNIDESILLGASLSTTSLSRRMSWASLRSTTRTEDLAYCLMGLFNVNMPLLYGEGPKAFIRLQEEIMKDSDDHSLFAWVPDAARFLPTLDLHIDFPRCRPIWSTWKEKSDTPDLAAVSENVRGVFASHPGEFSASWILQPRPGFLPLALDQPGEEEFDWGGDAGEGYAADAFASGGGEGAGEGEDGGFEFGEGGYEGLFE
ncbi:hypothetical protein GRF29_28g1226851 [Pseudopithomyces chartarum]|uniref:HET-domain-containing protein n=1 Tax=Pseudopithomyces chartarum TaxID=1892770 RepID=A0AAN6M151_9PLEO|nr:hypothetical protein GRF29_28g1226851 [Pseudopithomyces chartarum]